MFTSRPSDPTVALLWADRWWISGQPEPVVFGEAARAAEVLLAHFAEQGRPARLRLIYQPTSLVSTEVQCPNGGRAVLQAALQEEHPSLAQTTCAWSYEPIVGQGNTTLLHYETEPGLLPLVEALQEHGVTIEGAWPLATVLNLVPEEWPDTGALTVVAVAEDRSAVFRHTPAGQRLFHSAAGEAATELAAATVQEAFEREDAALCVVALDEAGERLAAQVAFPETSEPTSLTWPDVVRAAITLSPTQPNQLLPAPAKLNGKRIVAGLTTVALLTVAALGAMTVRETLEQRDRAARQTTATRELRDTVSALRENEIEALRLQAQLGAFTSRRALGGDWLRTLTRKLPDQVVLIRVQADRDGFSLTGGISRPVLTEPEWHAWGEAIQGGGVPWRLADTVGSPPESEFVLKGIWR